MVDTRLPLFIMELLFKEISLEENSSELISEYKKLADDERLLLCKPFEEKYKTAFSKWDISPEQPPNLESLFDIEDFAKLMKLQKWDKLSQY